MFLYRPYSGHKLIGETAYRNPYTIPKTTTPVKKIVPFSAFLFHHHHTKTRRQDAQKTVEAL